MESAHTVCRRAYEAALCERARLLVAARRASVDAPIGELERAYTHQLAWLAARLERCVDSAPLLLQRRLQAQCAGDTARCLQHRVELRPVDTNGPPLCDKFDAVLAAQVLSAVLERKMEYAARYTSDKVLLTAVRALLSERVWASVHGLYPHRVLRPPFEGALVEAAARVIVSAASFDHAMRECCH